MIRLLVLGLSCLFVLSCGGREEGSSGPYFDTKAFFNAELERMEAGSYRLTRETQYDDLTSELTIDTPQWADVFSLPLTFDLSNPANLGKYQVDSAETSVSYKELGNKNGGMSYVINYATPAKERVKAITTVLDRDNILYKSTKKVVYTVDEGMEISGFQDIRGNTENTAYIIKTVFEKL